MSLSQSLLPEFDHEMAMTRKVLDRIADDRLVWKPHPMSWDMRSLATHLATLPSWTNATIDLTELDYAPVGAPPYRAPLLETRAAILAPLRRQRRQGAKLARRRQRRDAWVFDDGRPQPPSRAASDARCCSTGLSRPVGSSPAAKEHRPLTALAAVTQPSARPPRGRPQ